MYRYLMILTVASAVGLQGWRTLFDNFAVNIAGLNGNHVGMIQSVREIPGLLTFLVIFVLMIIKEHRLSAIAILVMGIGVAVTGLFPSYMGIIATTMIMSMGFHYYETTNMSLPLQYFDKNTLPWVLGKQRSFAAASNICVGTLIFIIVPYMAYWKIYLLIGMTIIFAGLWAMTQNPSDRNIIQQHKKMIFRKKYWLFYFLTFMAGARRQIFVAFAVFLLVWKFSYSVQEITLLFMLNNFINYFLSPMIGKAIIRFGERKVLSLEYFSLIFIFSAYALIESKSLAGFLYVLDHIFFNFSIAIRTYFQKVGDPKDIAPSMAVSFAINHIAAVFLPAIGGMLWIIDYRIPFAVGAGMSIISLFAVQLIQIPAKANPTVC